MATGRVCSDAPADQASPEVDETQAEPDRTGVSVAKPFFFVSDRFRQNKLGCDSPREKNLWVGGNQPL